MSFPNFESRSSEMSPPLAPPEPEDKTALMGSPLLERAEPSKDALQVARSFARLDAAERGTRIIEELAAGLDPRTMLFAPRAQFPGEEVVLEGMVGTRQLGRALIEGFQRAFPNHEVKTRLETPLRPAEFVRVVRDNQPLRAAPNPKADRVTSAWRLPDDPHPGCLAVVLRRRGLPLLGGPGEETQVSPYQGEDWMLIQLPDGYIGNVQESACEPVDTDTWRKFWDARRSPDRERALIDEARRYLGAPYVWGGASRKQGLDCSSFVQMIWARTERIVIPRDSSQQARLGAPAGLLENWADLFPGDVLFFINERGKIYHVALSLGGPGFLHADGSQGVIEQSLDPDSSVYAPKRAADFAFARRWRI